MTTASVFADHVAKHYPHRYVATISMHSIVGGVPKDAKVIKNWIESKGMERDDQIRALIAETVIEMGCTEAQAVADLEQRLSGCGFKRDEGGLYIEGRQIKAMLKEAANIARGADRLGAKWGTTRKGTVSFVAEHVFVPDDRVHLGVTEPTGTHRRFIHKMTARGPVSAFNVEDYVEDCQLTFTVESDHPYTDDEWAAIWLTAERNGLGASRSQGFGTFAVTRWEKIAG